MSEILPSHRDAMLKFIERLMAENADMQKRIVESRREIERLKAAIKSRDSNPGSSCAENPPAQKPPVI